MYIRYSKSTENPATASASVQKYLEVAYIVNDLLGTRTPQDWAGAQGEIIKEVSYITVAYIPLLTFYQIHLCTFMQLSSIWWNECFETLRLLSLYGVHGRYYSDVRVADCLESSEIRNTPRIRLLKLLRSIHNTWIGDRKLSL